MEEFRSFIGSRTRELRRERRWTQEELSARLGLSQSRLSQIERGEGSFTAEQLITLLQLFNVDVHEFLPAHTSRDRQLELQNALARLGARHLRENENVLPQAELAEAEEVVRRALIAGEPRLVTALGPVLLDHLDGAELSSLDARLSETGHQRRLGWAVENTVRALEDMERLDVSQSRQRKLRRRLFVLKRYLKFALDRQQKQPEQIDDLLDPEVRSERGLEAVRNESSTISRRWGIVTTIQPSDFANALRAAYAGD